MPSWIDFAGATQAAQIRRTVTGKIRQKAVEVVFLLTSADHTTAGSRVLAEQVKHHWRIEITLRRARDVTLDEDCPEVRTRDAPGVMVTMRYAATSLLSLDDWDLHRLRHHTRDPAHVSQLLLTR